MSVKKDKKTNNLRQAHIWPSVVFFIISLLVAAIGFAAFVILTTTLIAQERFEGAISNAISMGRSLEVAEGFEQKLADGLEGANLTDSLFVLDKDGNVIAGFGEATYGDNVYTGRVQDPFSDDTYSAYEDMSPEPNLIDKSGSPNLSALLTSDGMSRILELSSDENNVVFEARFWLEYKLSGGRTAMIKCVAPLRFLDFDRSLVMGIIALLVMVLPLVFFFVNVIISVHHQRRTTDMLYTDTITGGSSLILFEHVAESELSAHRNYNKWYIIADIKIMKYRSYCNFHGARKGEELLGTVDKALNDYLGRGEICARSGESSFALFLKCVDGEQGAERMESMMNELSEKFREDCIVFHAGVYFSEPEKMPSDRLTDPADCLSRAGAARTKLTDENVPACSIYNEKLLEELRWRHKVEEKMQSALDNEEFHVYIQPKYDPVSEKLAGAEALIRWINDEDGFVPPGRFIPIFENNGFITKIDDYMISHVSKLQSEWIAAGKSVVPISVNVSRAHFADPDLAEHICSLVDKYGVPHDLLEIELTESAFFDDKAALLRTVHKLRDLGFEISMDDFGAGYSSLNSLKDLPLDVLKLDADFFRGEDNENRGEIVVSQAIRLAKSLNMRIVAEGVEKKEQVDFLAGQGCDMIQGYYYAKPMPADEYEQRLD